MDRDVPILQEVGVELAGGAVLISQNDVAADRLRAAILAGDGPGGEVILGGRWLAGRGPGLADRLNELGGAVGIPMVGRAESLNVGVACAVLCFEALRQRRSLRAP